LTDELAEEWGKKVSEVFDQMARDCMLNGPQMWKELKSTKDFHMSKEHQEILQDVLRGEINLSKDDVVAVAKTYGKCPVFYAFKQYAETNKDVDQKLINSLASQNQLVEELACKLV